MQPNDRLLTIPEAAAYLRQTPGAIYTQRSRGDKPGTLGIRIGKKVVFDRADLDAYVAELKGRRFESTSYPA